MKTLIIYGTTYGYTQDCAVELSKQLTGEISLVNVMKEVLPALKDFDQVVLGGSIYMGQIQKQVKEYCLANQKELATKRLGFFLCCGLPENFDQNLKQVFPEELLQQAIVTKYFGGELRVQKMRFMHKLVTGLMTRAAAKEGKALPKALPEKIAEFAQVMNGLC